MSGKEKVPYLPNAQRLRPPLKYNPLYIERASLMGGKSNKHLTAMLCTADKC